jgi:SMI1 / KNR4 family (SUKH-1)
VTDSNLDGRLTALKLALESHGDICVGEPLCEDALQEFERRHSIILPEGYRRFLLDIGDGSRQGPPSYGLLGLLAGSNDEVYATHLSQLRREFPFTEHWVWEGEPDDEARRVLVDQGTLILGTDGCGQYWMLVVTGPDRGAIWMLADVGVQPCCPRLDFLGWFEYWLSGGDDWWRDFPE